MFKQIAAALILTAGMAQGALAETYEVDPVHTSVVFRIGHLMVSHVVGRFNGATGTIQYDPAAPEKSRFDTQVEAKNIDTGNNTRDNDLRSANFFDVQKYPIITFKTTSVKPAGEGALNVTGDLSLHGVTKSITVPMRFNGTAKDPQGATRAGFETELSIKRSDYGMKHMIPAVGDEVKLTIILEAKR